MDSAAMYFGFEIIGLLVLVLLIGYLFAMALVVRNFGYIAQYPVNFLFECILWFAIPALPIFYFTASKGIKLSTAYRWYLIIGFVMLVLHTLFHLSGFYDYLFANELAAIM